MQEELLQFKLRKGYTQEERIDYDEVFAPVARIEAIRLFLAYAFFMGFMVYQMDVKSAFCYGRIEEEVYVCQPLGFEDPNHPDKVYKVVKALYGLHQAQKACQDKYVTEVLRKFNFSDVKTANTPVDTEKHLVKDADGDDVDVNLYRSIIRSLMYLTASRPDIMYGICVCARFQVTPKVSHLHAFKIIFRYLKSKPKLGHWYPRDSPLELVAYTDSGYVGASIDRKSKTEGCQFLGRRLISWQCKKQTVIATSTTKAEYMAVASCCGQVKQSIMDGFVDGKKVIVNEASIRRDLRLDDAEANKVLSLEKIKTNQSPKIKKLKKRAEKLEGKKKKRTHGLKRMYKVGLSARVESSEEEGLGNQEDTFKHGRIAKIDADKYLFLIDETTQNQGSINNQDEMMFDMNADLQGEEVVVDKDTNVESTSVNHRRTTGQPPPNHYWTTGQPPVNGGQLPFRDGHGRVSVLVFLGYGVLNLISSVVFSEVQAQICRIFLDGYGVFVGIKRLHEVTAAQLVMLVDKVSIVFNKVNTVSSRVTTVDRVTTTRWIKTKIT
uniref:Reverse transcriptase Ty1/copia-type domain-containing protein n=1 Tax=Tanacetum cinerariifolium TaxID=118510 RepID=A0A6L2N0C4_TANCI|nr:hypothetical protein [Tanacetum cinerariifolium]